MFTLTIKKDKKDEVVKIDDGHKLHKEVKSLYNAIRNVQPVDLSQMLIVQLSGETEISGSWKHGENTISAPATTLHALITAVTIVNDNCAKAFAALESAQTAASKAQDSARKDIADNPLYLHFNPPAADETPKSRGRKSKVDETLVALGLA